MVCSRASTPSDDVGFSGSAFSVGSGDFVVSDRLEVDILGSGDLCDILDKDRSNSCERRDIRDRDLSSSSDLRDLLDTDRSISCDGRDIRDRDLSSSSDLRDVLDCDRCGPSDLLEFLEVDRLGSAEWSLFQGVVLRAGWNGDDEPLSGIENSGGGVSDMIER